MSSSFSDFYNMYDDNDELLLAPPSTARFATFEEDEYEDEAPAPLPTFSSNRPCDKENEWAPGYPEYLISLLPTNPRLEPADAEENPWVSHWAANVPNFATRPGPLGELRHSFETPRNILSHPSLRSPPRHQPSRILNDEFESPLEELIAEHLSDFYDPTDENSLLWLAEISSVYSKRKALHLHIYGYRYQPQDDDIPVVVKEVEGPPLLKKMIGAHLVECYKNEDKDDTEENFELWKAGRDAIFRGRSKLYQHIRNWNYQPGCDDEDEEAPTVRHNQIRRVAGSRDLHAQFRKKEKKTALQESNELWEIYDEVYRNGKSQPQNLDEDDEETSTGDVEEASTVLVEEVPRVRRNPIRRVTETWYLPTQLVKKKEKKTALQESNELWEIYDQVRRMDKERSKLEMEAGIKKYLEGSKRWYEWCEAYLRQ